MYVWKKLGPLEPPRLHVTRSRDVHLESIQVQHVGLGTPGIVGSEWMIGNDGQQA
jgi:hypothetical protein